MKIYIAGSFQSQHRLRPLRDKLWKMGHEVISSWLDECAMPPGMTKDEFYRQLAVKDLTEVRAADCIILDTFDQSTTGGRMVEWGYALGHPKLKYVIGDADCLFLELADFKFKSWDELFIHFEEYRMYDDPLARLRSEAEQRARGHIKGMSPWGACA